MSVIPATNIRLLFAALICVACCACPAVPQSIDPSKYPATVPQMVVPYYISSEFSPEEVDIIVGSMKAWSKATGYRVAWEQSESSRALFIGPVWRQEDLPGVDHPNHKYIAITLRESNQILIVIDGSMGADQLRAIAAHELGHFLGLGHEPDGTEGTCMTSAPNPLCSWNGIPVRDRINFCRINHCDH